MVLLDAKLEEVVTAFEHAEMHLTPSQVDGLLRDVVTPPYLAGHLSHYWKPEEAVCRNGSICRNAESRRICPFTPSG